MSDIEIERWLSHALRRNVMRDPHATTRIMRRVRAEAKSISRPRTPLLRFEVRHSIIGLALAAGIGSITTVSTLSPPSDGARGRSTSAVIGDSVASTLRDTLRLVRLLFDDPGARRVAVVGDFNGWDAGTTALVRDKGSNRWSATLALRDGMHRYAFVVDGVRTSPLSMAPHRADDGMVYSLLHVARATN